MPPGAIPWDSEPMPTARTRRRTDALLEQASRTYAQEAGIRLTDKPGPLYQLAVLATLLSTRINSELAVAAARELRRAGATSPRRLRQTSWQDRVDALGRAHYRRYDESTATRLGEAADLVQDEYRGDLRQLADRADRDVAGARRLLQDLPGIGPVGADIFLREVQHVWEWARPFADERVTAAAAELGLPRSAKGLTALAGSDDLSGLGAALVRTSLDDELRERVEHA